MGLFCGFVCVWFCCFCWLFEFRFLLTLDCLLLFGLYAVFALFIVVFFVFGCLLWFGWCLGLRFMCDCVGLCFNCFVCLYFFVLLVVGVCGFNVLVGLWVVVACVILIRWGLVVDFFLLLV